MKAHLIGDHFGRSKELRVTLITSSIRRQILWLTLGAYIWVLGFPEGMRRERLLILGIIYQVQRILRSAEGEAATGEIPQIHGGNIPPCAGQTIE